MKIYRHIKILNLKQWKFHEKIFIVRNTYRFNQSHFSLNFG